MKTYFTKSFYTTAAVLLITICFYVAWGSSTPETDQFHGQVDKWVGSWATAPQLVEPRNMPPAPGLGNNILRQIVAVSIGGEEIRLRLSNEFGEAPVEIKEVWVSTSLGGAEVDETTSTAVRFNGQQEVIIAPGARINSDPFSYDLEPRERLAITISFGEVQEDLTGHPGSRTTSYLLSENQSLPDVDFSGAIETDHWYIINALDVRAPESAAAVAILGNSITDGRGSGTNEQNRWPDILSERLLANESTEDVGVLNMGIGGNAVLKGGLGPTGLERFERDILNQEGVRWLIIMEGVNDLGGTQDSIAAFQVAKDLISAYEDMIEKAHAENILVYGGTITPIKKSFYYTDFREEAREFVNDWIRNSGKFDAVIDFEKAIEDPNEESTILPAAQSGDYLHPNELGYKMMGEAIDLSLFSPESIQLQFSEK